MIEIAEVNSIFLPWESYLYLLQKENKERNGRWLSKRHIKNWKMRFDALSLDGYIRLNDGYLGGCSGNWKNGLEEGRWTSWSCDDMKRFLTEAGLLYVDGDKVRYVSSASSGLLRWLS